MRHIIAVLLTIALLGGSGCRKFFKPPAPTTAAAPVKSAAPRTAPFGAMAARPAEKENLVDARKGFQTKLVPQEGDRSPAPDPPAELFQKVKYDAPSGKLSAYLSVPKKKGTKLPAIIWITGGDCNSIDPIWKPAPPNNDQTAAAYWQAGIVTMYPSLRGGNDNPGEKEGFFGEVDDVLAAADYLAKQESVDPKRIYLGGHSTGGTLVFLAAECADRFRAVFSFGPADDVRGYPRQWGFTPFDPGNPREAELRSPGLWLHSVQCPLFVFEGTAQGNIKSLTKMARESTNPQAHFYPVEGGTHFSILFPLNKLIATKILADGDEGPTKISFTEQELSVVGKR
jgi:acetyl esterase/lipase